MTAAITVSNLGKQYRIGHVKERYRTLRETLAGAAHRLLHRRSTRAADTFWALKEVSFEVQPGEAVGIIGRNGAGKSTLLKILSSITGPTTGRVELRGRVGSLLEVGTGFHPELTGRENIFLNGAILGMKHAEIRAKFDEIVAFAEVEKFIDTPVKRYSSGMYVRLAFAVAAHLEPEILIVDEVLAVGDMQFQKKCMGKMESVSAREGRTVIFVSHNLAAVQQLCDRAILLDGGRVVFSSDSAKACEHYLTLVSGSESSASTIQGHGFVIQDLQVAGPEQGLPTPLKPAKVHVPVTFDQPCQDPHVHLFVQTMEGETVFGLSSGELSGHITYPPGRHFPFLFHIHQLPLLPGSYRVVIKVRSYENNINETLHTGFQFQVKEEPVYGPSILSRHWHGLVVVPASVEMCFQR